ncbi:MAG: hypothetical protein E7053_09020 [Lentisphaerae bacterium]|nr:hypothetical protein [Lentisphaerota bacterium]
MKHFVLLSLCLALFPLSGQVNFTSQNKFVLNIPGQTGCHGSIFVIEKDKGLLELRTGNANGKLVISNQDFSWEISIEHLPRLDCITGVIRNTSNRQLLLEPGIRLLVPRKNGDFYWPGFDVFDAGNTPLRRLGFKGRTSKHVAGGLCQPFPTSALISDSRVYILGGRMYELTSYTASEYLPENDSSAALQFSQRIVLEPGEELTLTFFCGSVPRRFDREQNVVEAFYEAMPADFRPFVGENNPYIRGIHSQYTAWANRPDYEAERRRYATLDWAYAPFKRDGDCYGRPDLWEYTPLYRPFAVTFCQYAVGENFDYRVLTCEEFHARRKSIFQRFGRKFGFSFYICSAWCEKQLAESRYADSLADDPSVPLELATWCTGHDSERRVFPLANNFGRALMQDIIDVVNELDMPGFAFDCGTPGVHHYGPAAGNPELKGRSWDDKGIFCDELCALNQIFDFIHHLRPDDPLYVWKNGEGKADIRMIETDLFGPIFSSWMPLTRYNAGQRPCVLHVKEGYLFASTIPHWRTLTRAQFIREWHKLGDHLLFSDFEYGMSNSIYGYGGNLQAQYTLPELLECINLGWRALIPVATPEIGDRMLYRARYGRMADTILFYGNPYETDIPLTFIIDNYGLGGGYQLFLPKMRDAAQMNNTIANGDTTITYTLPSRKPVLFEAAFSLSALPADGRLSAEVTSEKDIHRMIYSAKLGNTASFRAAITPRNIYNFNVTLKLNGKLIEAGEIVEIPAGAEITAEYRSVYFVNPASEIVSFPFTDNRNRPSFAIVLPDDASDDEKAIADYVRDYFRFTNQHRITAGKDLPAAAAGVPQLHIRIGRGGSNGIVRNGNTLTLTAENFRQAVQTYIALARIMDRRFPYYPPMAQHFQTTPAIARKFGIENLRLPWSRCFETRPEAR